MGSSLPVRLLPPPPGSSAEWARDFGFVGGITSLLAPACVVTFGPLAVPYLAASTLMGTLTGALLGVATRRLLRGRLRRVRKLYWLPLGGLLGALWGAVVGTTAGIVAGALSQSDWDLTAFMGLFSGTVAAGVGLLQLGWFWLAYSFLRMRRRATRPVMALSLALPLLILSVWLLPFAYGLLTGHPSRVVTMPLLVD